MPAVDTQAIENRGERLEALRDGVPQVLYGRHRQGSFLGDETCPKVGGARAWASGLIVAARSGRGEGDDQAENSGVLDRKREHMMRQSTCGSGTSKAPRGSSRASGVPRRNPMSGLKAHTTRRGQKGLQSTLALAVIVVWYARPYQLRPQGVPFARDPLGNSLRFAGCSKEQCLNAGTLIIKKRRARRIAWAGPRDRQGATPTTRRRGFFENASLTMRQVVQGYEWSTCPYGGDTGQGRSGRSPPAQAGP